MTDIGITLFDTAIGRCGVAWAGARLRAVQLPERSHQATVRRLVARAEAPVVEDPPPAVQRAIDAMTALLAGQESDLEVIAIDLDDIADFDRAVYAVTRSIRPGQTMTYGEVARLIGDPGAARAVGRALGANPLPIVIPCHRVLGADGRLVGFSANGGVDTKRRMLLIEGCPAVAPSLFD